MTPTQPTTAMTTPAAYAWAIRIGTINTIGSRPVKASHGGEERTSETAMTPPLPGEANLEGRCGPAPGASGGAGTDGRRGGSAPTPRGVRGDAVQLLHRLAAS